jgi:ribosomal protein S4
LFYTPAVNETGNYQFTHLGAGTYHVREIVPALLSATPAAVREQPIELAVGEQRTNVNFADVYRANEIHGLVFNDLNRNHVRDPGEPGIGGVTVWLDLNRDTMTGTVKGMPAREAITLPIEEQMIVEFYSR